MIFVEETDERFYIADSIIPNAGLGCFAKTLIKKGDWLEVIGVYVKTGGIADECTHYAKRYKFAGSPKMNAKIIPIGYAGMVNHSDNLKNCVLEYAPDLGKRSQHSGQVVYRFIKDVFPGEEVIGNYGPNVGEEIKKISQDLAFKNQVEKEWNDFLKFNLYDLQKLETT